MRRACVAGNWKMHKTISEAETLIKEMLPGLNAIEEVDNLICPPFTALDRAGSLLRDSKVGLGAQNLFWEDQGAFTGEISPLMLAELVEYVIIGHSERRAYFQDTDQVVNKKVKAAFKAGLEPIICVGETLEENEADETGEVVVRQLRSALADVPEGDFRLTLIAYEPIWAIGTGRAATPEGANQVIKDHIRDVLSEMYSPSAAEETRILYGGSVKPGNARDFFQQPDIDGALVGGASLRAEDFIKITEAAV